MSIFTDDDNTFTGLFFQDHLMKSSFASYPEIIFIDATYKLNELRMPLYLMLVVDGNGQSEIVMVFITAVETEIAITNLVQTFKTNNPRWAETRVVMTDKDLTSRAVFQQEFPAASLHICLFHVLRSFRREITCEKLGLRSGERDHALELMTKLAYSKSESEYDDHYQSLLESGLKSVINYYNSNWHPVRREWVECFKSADFTLGENTNNRLECITAKVKSVCSKYVSLSKFFDQFFAVLTCLRNERDHATIMALVKKRVIVSDNSDDEEYARVLTPYAFKLVCKQKEQRMKVKIAEDGTVNSSAGLLLVTAESCQCSFWNTMHLPCKHIFAVREQKSLPVFSSAVIAERWKTNYLQEAFNQKISPELKDSFQVNSRQGAC